MINQEFLHVFDLDKNNGNTTKIMEKLSCVLLSASTHEKPKQSKVTKTTTEIKIEKFNTRSTISEKYYKPISKMITPL